MSHDEDLYQILGIHSEADPVQIKEAYIYKVNILHTDRLTGMAERIRLRAQDDLKKVNAAYEILSDPTKRQEYDRNRKGITILSSSRPEHAWSSSEPPKAEVHPRTIQFDRVLPYVPEKGSFWVRNVGGAYRKILISEPPEWLKVVRIVPVQGDTKLPMRVDIEAVGIQWGKVYSSGVTVRLDDKEARVKIKLCMQKKPRRS